MCCGRISKVNEDQALIETSIPVTGSFKYGHIIGIALNGVAFATCTALALTALKKDADILLYVMIPLGVNLAKDVFGLLSTRVHYIDPSEIDGVKGTVDLQYHLKKISEKRVNIV